MNVRRCWWWNSSVAVVVAQDCVEVSRAGKAGRWSIAAPVVGCEGTYPGAAAWVRRWSSCSTKLTIR